VLLARTPELLLWSLFSPTALRSIVVGGVGFIPLLLLPPPLLLLLLVLEWFRP
jgi:hypothetical protein